MGKYLITYWSSLSDQIVIVLKHGGLLVTLFVLLLFLLLLNVILPAFFSSISRRHDTFLFIELFLSFVIGSDFSQLSFMFGQLSFGGESLTSCNIIAVKAQNLGYFSNHILSEVLPVSAGITREVDFLQILAPYHLVTGVLQIFEVHEIESQIQLVETLAATNTLYSRNRIDGQIQILQLFQLLEACYFLDQIVLEVKNFKMTAMLLEAHHILDIELMERYFFQSAQHALIVLSFSPQQISCDLCHYYYTIL